MVCARAQFEQIFDQVANALASAFSIKAAFQCSPQSQQNNRFAGREPEAEAEDE
jgi:hypothetical protein